MCDGRVVVIDGILLNILVVWLMLKVCDVYLLVEFLIDDVIFLCICEIIFFCYVKELGSIDKWKIRVFKGSFGVFLK